MCPETVLSGQVELFRVERLCAAAEAEQAHMNLKTKTNQAKRRMSLSRTDCKRFRTAAALLFFLFVPALLFALDYTEHPLDYYKENHSADYDFALATSRKIYGELTSIWTLTNCSTWVASVRSAKGSLPSLPTVWC